MTEYLTQQQLERLQALTKVPRDRLLIRTQYETGCTVSELVEIKREDLGKDHIKVGERKSHVSKSLLEALRAYLRTHHSPYVFTSRQNNSLTTKRVQQIIKQALKRLDADLEKQTPHLLRYTHIVHAAKQRIPLKAIMDQTGLAEQRVSQILSELPSQEEEYGRLFA